MQSLSSFLDYINPFSSITNNPGGNQTNNTNEINTIAISKHIFGRSFDSYSQLPYHSDIWKVIFSNFNFSDLLNSCSLSVECYKLANDPVLSKIAIYRDFCFNPSDWNKFFGEGSVSNDEMEKAFDALPKNINEILKSPCPAFPGKRIMDTHMLVWIPESVKDKPLTIDSFGLLMKQQPEFSSNPEGYQYVSNEVVQGIGSDSIKSGWVLMTTDNIPDSRSKSFSDQQELIKKLNKDGKTDYRLPHAGEAIVSIYAKYLKSGTKKRLFSNKPWTCTRCQENIRGSQVVVGGFALSGLFVRKNFYVSGNFGVAGLRKF